MDPAEFVVEAMHRALFVEATATGAATGPSSVDPCWTPLGGLDFVQGALLVTASAFAKQLAPADSVEPGRKLLGADAEVLALAGVDETIGSHRPTEFFPRVGPIFG